MAANDVWLTLLTDNASWRSQLFRPRVYSYGLSA